MDIQNFTDLQVWQRSMDLVVAVYRITEAYPRHELFVLTGQTHKSVISIPSNISEGFCRARRSLPAYLNHLNIAMGSEGELYSQLEIGRRLKYATGKELVFRLTSLVSIEGGDAPAWQGATTEHSGAM